MRFYLLLIFFTLHATTYLSAEQIRTYYYKSPLSLYLLTLGSTDFLNECKDLPEENFETALCEVISLAPINNTNIPRILTSIENTLNYKINRIERVEGKTIDREDIVTGLSCIGIGIGLSYALYYVYKNYYSPKSTEYYDIKTTLESIGGILKTNPIQVFRPEGTDRSYWNSQAKRLHELDKSCESYAIGLCAGALAPLGAFFFGTGGIISGFNPHTDDQYLEKYKNLLAITKKLQSPKA
jgi:hypothetical protein